MNILLVCASYGGGGAERVAANLSSTIVQQGHTVSFYYWIDKGKQAYALESKVILKKAPGHNFFSRVIGLRRQIIKTRPDVVIGYTDMSNIICYTAMKCLKDRPVFIATIHSDLRARDANLHTTWRLRLVRYLHKKSCLFSERVVVVSGGAKSSLIDYYKLPDSKVDMIYNPVLEEVNDLNRVKTFDEPLKIVAAGRLTLAKNYPLLFNAINILTAKYDIRCELTIYGDGELREELEKNISRLGLSEIIKLKGFVKELTNEFKSYDIFVMSSTWEGLPTVLVEALNAGLRVVSTDCPSGPSEILAQGKYGELVPVDDTEQLALAILRSTDNPPQQEAENDEFYKHLRNFTNQEVYKKYMNLISQVRKSKQFDYDIKEQA